MSTSLLQPVYFYIITPRPELNEEEFERFLMGEVFPELQVLQRNVRNTWHSLLKGKEADGKTQYLWMMTLDLIGSGSATGGVDRVSVMMNEKLKPHATLSSPLLKISSPEEAQRLANTPDAVDAV
jgi:hypothetical protein